MHQHEGEAIVLHAALHGEHGAVVDVFSKHHGKMRGFVPHVRRKLAILQPGNLVHVIHKARTAQQLGTMTLEILRPYAAQLMPYNAPMQALLSVCALYKTLMPEHVAHSLCYEGFGLFLQQLCQQPHVPHFWLRAYVELEYLLLAELGYRLDTTRCALTGRVEDLAYISPKTGRAANREAAAIYADKLLPLPAFMCLQHAQADPSRQDLIDGLALTEYFLHHWALAPHGLALPSNRAQLVRAL